MHLFYILKISHLFSKTDCITLLPSFETKFVNYKINKIYTFFFITLTLVEQGRPLTNSRQLIHRIACCLNYEMGSEEWQRGLAKNWSSRADIGRTKSSLSKRHHQRTNPSTRPRGVPRANKVLWQGVRREKFRKNAWKKVLTGTHWAPFTVRVMLSMKCLLMRRVNGTPIQGKLF